MKFEFEGKGVRTSVNESQMTEWVAVDVARLLGYASPHKAIKKHCKGWAKRPVPDFNGKNLQQAIVIDEPNLYRLIAHSKLPSAEKFEKWVFEIVLPSIRKQGGYIAPSATSDQLSALQVQLHNMRIEVQHWQKIAEVETMTAEAWKARSEYGSLSKSNQLPKLLKRRGAWVADPRFRQSIELNFEQGTFKFIESNK